MDPEVAWHRAKQGHKESGIALAEWLLKGGFPPKDKTAEEVLLWLHLTFGIELDSSQESA